MFQNLWRFLRQDEFITSLKTQIEIERKEKLELQEVLHKVLKLHLIPKDRTELIISEQPKASIQTQARSARSMLTELQRKSYDESVRREIEVEEKRISELETQTKGGT